MHAAVSDEMTDAVQLLLDRGADINRLAGDSTALTYAVSGGAIENVTLLLIAELTWKVCAIRCEKRCIQPCLLHDAIS